LQEVSERLYKTDESDEESDVTRLRTSGRSTAQDDSSEFGDNNKNDDDDDNNNNDDDNHRKVASQQVPFY